MLSTTATAASPVGSYTITAADSVDADYTFIYQAGTLNVTPDNLAPPVANNDSAVLDEDASALIAVLANDSGARRARRHYHRHPAAAWFGERHWWAGALHAPQQLLRQRQLHVPRGGCTDLPLERGHRLAERARREPTLGAILSGASTLTRMASCRRSTRS